MLSAEDVSGSTFEQNRGREADEFSAGGSCNGSNSFGRVSLNGMHEPRDRYLLGPALLKLS